MKTLQLYLTRQVIASLLMTVAVFTLVFLLVNLFNDILTFLVKGQVSLGIFFRVLGLLIPYVMVFALPMALLAATLLVFGRFSADQELTAARASGSSLLSLVAPILVLSLLLCGVCAWVSLELAPRSRVTYKELRFKFEAKLAGALLPEGQFIRNYATNMIIYVGKNRGGQLENVTVALLDGTNTEIFRAARGAYHEDFTNRQLRVELYEVKAIRTVGGQDILGYSSHLTWSISLGGNSSETNRVRISDMTFSQFRAELRELEGLLTRSAALDGLTPEQLRLRKADLDKQVKDLTSPLRVQLHRQVALSFACFSFTLIGIPLAIRMHRRETNINFAIALILVLVYYGFLVVAHAFSGRPELSPHLIVWMPNFVFTAIGAVLLWRANRGA